jgi:hypothetical protein
LRGTISAPSILASTVKSNSTPRLWSCSYCTFANPNTTRVCGMCDKSKP